MKRPHWGGETAEEEKKRIAELERALASALAETQEAAEVASIAQADLALTTSASARELRSARIAIRGLFGTIEYLSEAQSRLSARAVTVLALCARQARGMLLVTVPSSSSDDDDPKDTPGDTVCAMASDSFKDHVVIMRGVSTTKMPEALNRFVLASLPSARPFRVVAFLECCQTSRAQTLEARIRAHFRSERLHPFGPVATDDDVVYAVDAARAAAFWDRLKAKEIACV